MYTVPVLLLLLLLPRDPRQVGVFLVFVLDGHDDLVGEGAVGNCIKKGLPRKSILGDYTVRRPVIR